MIHRVNLKNSIYKVMIQLLPYLEAKDIDLDIEVEDCYVRGDQAMLKQAVFSYLQFAIQHTPSGGHIQLRCKQDAKKARVALEYNGRINFDGESAAMAGVEAMIQSNNGKYGTRITRNGICSYFELLNESVKQTE